MDSGMGGGGIHFILGQQTSKHKSSPLRNVWGLGGEGCTHLNNKNGHTFFGHVTLYSMSIVLFSSSLIPWVVVHHPCGVSVSMQDDSGVYPSQSPKGNSYDRISAMQSNTCLSPLSVHPLHLWLPPPPTWELFMPGAARPCPTWSSGWVHPGGWLTSAKCWCGRSVKKQAPGDIGPGVVRWPVDRPGCAWQSQPTGRCKERRGSRTVAWDTRSPSGSPER